MSEPARSYFKRLKWTTIYIAAVVTAALVLRILEWFGVTP
jgi:hypothetical protein